MNKDNKTTMNIEGWKLVKSHNEEVYAIGVGYATEVKEAGEVYWATAGGEEWMVEIVWKTAVFTEVTPAYMDGNYCNQMPTPPDYLEEEMKKITDRPQYVRGSKNPVAGWCGDGGDCIFNSARYIWAEVAE